jgi:DNA-binding NarL/FixJ family response regulator
VIACLWQGLSDNDISTRLSICEGTVHRHLKKLFKKLGVHNRQEAARQFLALIASAGGAKGGTGRRCFECDL